MRMENERSSKKVLHCAPLGRRRGKGRPRVSWREILKMEECNSKEQKSWLVLETIGRNEWPMCQYTTLDLSARLSAGRVHEVGANLRLVTIYVRVKWADLHQFHLYLFNSPKEARNSRSVGNFNCKTDSHTTTQQRG